MKRWIGWFSAPSLLGLALLGGCARQVVQPTRADAVVPAGVTRNQATSPSTEIRPATATSVPQEDAKVDQIKFAAHDSSVHHLVHAARRQVPCNVDDPFALYSELPLPLFIDAVLARNQSLAAMTAAWRAAAQRYPQVVSLEDPMFSGSFGPKSLDSEQVEPAYMLEAGQKIPWPGKRALRGQAARAEANAARYESFDARLKIIEAAQTAFLDYYLVHQLAGLNARNTQLVREFRDTAQSRYISNLVPQQDVLSAELELLELQRRGLELRRMEVVAIARINTLLHRPPDFPLPPPPAQLHDDGDLPPPELLRQTALVRRPDLAMLSARIRAEQANLGLAYKEYYPDAEVWYRYDRYWQPAESDLRSQLGMNVNVPLYQQRRHAAVREALFRISQRRAELAQRADDVQNEVQSAAARVTESQQIVILYQRHSLPLAEQAVESARATYVAGGIDFLRLLEAYRRRLMLQEKRVEAIAEYHRRLAELERTVAGPIPRLAPPEELPAATTTPSDLQIEVSEPPTP